MNRAGASKAQCLEGVCVYMNCVPGCSIQGRALSLVMDEKGNYCCPICKIIRIESHPEKKEPDPRLNGVPDWWIKESREIGRPL